MTLRKFLIFAFTAVSLMAAASVGTAPPSAFDNLQTMNCSLNQDYCSGYIAGELQPIPLPTLQQPEIWDYYATVRKLEFPRFGNGAIINYSVGYDSAMENAAAYFWQNSPTSCHNVDCSVVH